MSEIIITKENFEKEVLNSPIPVLLDFWAIWCGPCRMIAPTIAEIAEEYAGKIKVGKVNVNDESELASQFNIVSIPTIVLIDGGKPVASAVGYMGKEHLLKELGI